MPNKNERLVKLFVSYCEANPGLRFWQALRNFAQIHVNADINHVLIASGYGTDEETGEIGYLDLEDTFYWEDEITV